MNKLILVMLLFFAGVVNAASPLPVEAIRRCAAVQADTFPLACKARVDNDGMATFTFTWNAEGADVNKIAELTAWVVVPACELDVTGFTFIRHWVSDDTWQYVNGACFGDEDEFDGDWETFTP